MPYVAFFRRTRSDWRTPKPPLFRILVFFFPPSSRSRRLDLFGHATMFFPFLLSISHLLPRTRSRAFFSLFREGDFFLPRVSSLRRGFFLVVEGLLLARTSWRLHGFQPSPFSSLGSSAVAHFSFFSRRRVQDEDRLFFLFPSEVLFFSSHESHPPHSSCDLTRALCARYRSPPIPSLRKSIFFLATRKGFPSTMVRSLIS